MILLSLSSLKVLGMQGFILSHFKIPALEEQVQGLAKESVLLPEMSAVSLCY